MSDIVNVRSTIAANGGVVVIRTGGMPVVGIELEGAWVGTLHIQETVSGDGFVDGQVTNAAGTPVSAIITGNGKFFVAAAGRSAIQVIATAWTSGAATVIGVPTEGSAGGSSGGGGGGAVTIGDGGSITFGAQADAAATSDTGTFSFISLLKRGLQKFSTLLGVLPAALVGGRLDVNLGAAGAGVSVGVNKIPGTISTANSSTVTLTSGAVFTGTAEDVSGFAAIIVNVFADVAGTLAPQFSSDGTHWDGTGSHAITAATFAVFEFRPGAQFFRLVYTNGGTNQATMRLQTVYHQDDVQLATVMALAAGMPNPTTEQIGADLLVQTGGGTTWAPAKADSSNRPVIASDDGSLNTLGTTTNAGIITDIAGTVIGFLRGSIIQWAAFLARFPAALGSTTAANSLPVTLSTDGQFTSSTGALTETAPATDTASSGLNGRLQRVAQRLSSLIALLPTALVSNRLDVNLGAAPATVTVQGGAATGAIPAGNPLLLGGVDPAGGTTVQNLQIQAAATPNLRVSLYSGSTLGVLAAANLDSQFNNSAYLPVLAVGAAHSGATGSATVDRTRHNVDATLLASAARTTTQTGSNITAYNCQAIAVTLDVTAIVSTCSLTVTIGYVDPASGKVINLLTSAVIAAVSTTMLLVDPRVVAAANLVAMKPIGRVFVITVTVGNANSQTYSVGYTLIPC